MAAYILHHHIRPLTKSPHQDTSASQIYDHMMHTFKRMDMCYRHDLPQAALPVLFLLTGRFWGFSPRSGDTMHRSRLHERMMFITFFENNARRPSTALVRS